MRCERVAATGRSRSSASSAPRNTSTDRKSTRLNSSHGYISYAVFCLKKKKKISDIQSELSSKNRNQDGKYTLSKNTDTYHLQSLLGTIIRMYSCLYSSDAQVSQVNA